MLSRVLHNTHAKNWKYDWQGARVIPCCPQLVHWNTDFQRCHREFVHQTGRYDDNGTRGFRAHATTQSLCRHDRGYYNRKRQEIARNTQFCSILMVLVMGYPMFML